MAKELPFFKFEPNQWENGNIQICSRDEKGLFIDLCCMYWSRLGDVPLKLAINKLCAGNATAFDSLMRENIFTVIDGLICIDFLNEQLDEFDNTSKVNSKNAKDGWIKRRLAKEESERNATASIPQCENDAIREEKKREEEIIEEDIKQIKFDFKKSLLYYGFNETLVLEWLKIRKLKKNVNSQTAFNGFISEVEKNVSLSPNEILKICVERSWSGFKNEWLTKNTQNGNTKDDGTALLAWVKGE